MQRPHECRPARGRNERLGQTHDIKNLFISDGSAMTTAGAAIQP